MCVIQFVPSNVCHPRCVWELYCTISSEKAELVVAFPPRQRGALEDALTSDFDSVVEAMGRVSAERARCFDPRDTEWITEAIRRAAAGV